MEAKVSVIIPAYNSQHFILRAIYSVLNQQHKNVEIIVIDDRSTDATAEIVKAISIENPQVFLYSNTHAKGPSGARNTGLDKAKGNYIAFLDADDIWHPNHLNGINFLEKNQDVDMIFFNFHITNDPPQRAPQNWFSERKSIQKLQNKSLSDGFYLIEDDIFLALIREAFIHLQSMIVKKSVCNNIYFDEKITRSEDRDFAVQLVMDKQIKIAFKDEITGIYFLHSNNLTKPGLDNELKTCAAHIHIFQKYLSKYPLTSQQFKTLKETLTNRHLTLCYTYRELGDYSAAFKLCFKSLKYGITHQTFSEVCKTLYFLALREIKSQRKPLILSRKIHTRTK